MFHSEDKKICGNPPELLQGIMFRNNPFLFTFPFCLLFSNRMRMLAPDIVKLIWENRQPETLTLDNLRKGIPESWEEQRKLFFS